MKLSVDAYNQLFKLITHYESLHDGDLSQIGLQPKMCPAGIWTEGYGSVIYYGGKPLRGHDNKQLAYSISTIHDVNQAFSVLSAALDIYERKIDSLKLNINDFQKAALISFSYNCGFGALLKSSLLKSIKDGSNDSVIAANFMKWNKAAGKVLRGLTARRNSEIYLYFKHEFKAFN